MGIYNRTTGWREGVLTEMTLGSNSENKTGRDTGRSAVESLGGQRRGICKGPGGAGSLGEGHEAGVPRAQGSCRMRLEG